jgi:hypothetical protein
VTLVVETRSDSSVVDATGGLADWRFERRLWRRFEGLNGRGSSSSMSVSFIILLCSWAIISLRAVLRSLLSPPETVLFRPSLVPEGGGDTAGDENVESIDSVPPVSFCNVLCRVSMRAAPALFDR